MRIDKRDICGLFAVLFVALVCEIVFFYKQATPMVDIGREFYLAQRVAEGGVLYKDIFNIYGPLSYQINALLFLIFGQHTHVLYLFGNLVGLLLIGTTYVLSRLYLDRFYSICVALFMIFTGICSAKIFNLVVPYAFSATYGLLMVIISLILFIKFIRDDEKIKYYYGSVFFAGAAFITKYDFLLYVIGLLISVLLVKRVSFLVFLKGLLAFSVIPLISVLQLFIVGLNIQDIINSVELFKDITSAPSLAYFYKIARVYPTVEAILYNIRNLVLFSFVLVGSYFVLNKLEGKSRYWFVLVNIFLIAFLFSFFFNYLKNFSFLPVVILSLLLFLQKKIADKSVWVLCISTLLISAKKIFYADCTFYSVFFISLLVLSAIVLFEKYIIENHKLFKRMIVALMIVFFIPQLFAEKNSFAYYRYKVQTPKGVMYIGNETNPTRLLLDIVLKNTKKDDSVVILPEGHIINFLTDRKTDDMYSNLIPMYVEAFGEKKIIEHYSQNMPNYFVFSTRDVDEYDKEGFCKDYALNFCSWVFNNYHLEYKIIGMPSYFVLRKN